MLLFDNPEYLTVCHLSGSMVTGLKEFYCILTFTGSVGHLPVLL